MIYSLKKLEHGVTGVAKDCHIISEEEKQFVVIENEISTTKEISTAVLQF